ncbi:MAG: aminotransferase class III-fold pyridoxal phosphate-dependent enzyme [Bacteroidetes bacterium]|nr:aminotransferase class III-fold pyridoxal phosphate-dependent enzyme [Bacteroidota bacterium]
MSTKFKKSEELLKIVETVIPLGSQTFSKSKVNYPFGVSPYFAKKAKGAYLWDVDDNKYVDYISSLLSVTLGYADEDVNKAVAAQLELGSIFSIASELEYEVGKAICEMVPCAEMVRFGKNGSDATAGAVRLARAVTKRDDVIVCGYHGWQDWYIGSTTRNLGVPKATSDLTHTFQYNDISSLEEQFKKLQGKVAAVVMEPTNVYPPAEGFLQQVKDLAHKNGALLIFDETITGFRFAKGGAQELYGVTPDLATFGKGLANGFPLSAIAGKREYMKLMEEVFFSFTFGGDTLSLAASKANLIKLNTQPILESIHNYGNQVIDQLVKKISDHQLDEFFEVKGHPAWSFLIFKEQKQLDGMELTTLMVQEMLDQGLIYLGTHNMNYCHREAEIKQLMNGYDVFFSKVNEALKKGNISSLLNCKPLVPLFKVR